MTDVGWYTEPPRGRYSSLTAWSNGTSATYRNRDYENGTLKDTRYNEADNTHSPNESLAAEFVARNLADGNYTYEQTITRNNERLYVFTAEGLSPNSEDHYVDGSFTGRLVVDEHGRIRSFRGSFATVVESVRLNYTLRYDLRRVGTVEIERPEFVSAAAEAGQVDRCTDTTADYDCTSD